MARGGFGGRSGGAKSGASRSSGIKSGGFHTSHSIGSRGHIGGHFGSHSHMGMRSHHGYRSYGRGRGMANPGQTFQTSMDAIAAKKTGATIANGVVTLEGSQASVINHLNTLANSQDVIMYIPQPQLYPNPLNTQMSMMGMQNQMNMQNQMAMQNQMGMQNQMAMQNQMGNPMQNQMGMPMPMPTPMGQMMMPQPIMMVPVVAQTNVVNEVHITVVGNKTAPSDVCCFVLTIVFASFCLFPLLFMCCAWWKKMVYPKYDLDPQFYRALGRYLRKQNRCKTLVLTVVDNGFDAQKARLLGQSLAGTALTSLTFVNAALDCNYLTNEADEFRVNMVPIKSMPFTSSVIWGDMIL